MIVPTKPFPLGVGIKLLGYNSALGPESTVNQAKTIDNRKKSINNREKSIVNREKTIVFPE